MTLDDAEAIGHVHVRAWQAAYAGVMPHDFLAGLQPTQRADWWRSHLAGAPPDRPTLVAVDDGRPVGFVHYGPARGDEALGEIYAVNIDPSAFGRGVGQALFAAAVAALVEAGFGDLVLWVAGENARARRFYERNGWRPDGAEQHGDFGGATVVELRYRTSSLPEP